MQRDSDKMVYGVEAALAPQAPPTCAGGCGGCAIHPAPPGLGEPAATAFDPWSDSQYPWACPPCTPEAQEGLWLVDAFGKGKGKAKGERGPMACYNCLGLGHPERLCASKYGAGKAQTGPKCKTCGGFGHDTPTCTSKGGAKVKARARTSRHGARAKELLSGAKAPTARAKEKFQPLMTGRLKEEGHGTNGARHPVMPSGRPRPL